MAKITHSLPPGSTKTAIAGGEMNEVKLRNVAMRTVTDNFVYAPTSRTKTVTLDYFLSRYADHALSMLVSFEPDFKSQPQRVTAYGYGLDAWWIVEADDVHH